MLMVIMAASCKRVAPNEPQTDPTMDSTAFVNNSNVVPDAILEIRYFSTCNFVGARIDGYLG